MKRALTIALLLSFASLQALAEDVKPFDQMTLQELEAINPASLQKDAAKAHKKALKTARKAEKARLKAEEKRKKAEEKRLKKARKAAGKSVSYINEIRQKTAIYKDDFEAHITIGGDARPNRMESFSEMMAAPDAVTYSLHGVYFPDSNSLSLQAFVFMQTSLIVPEEDWEKMQRHPERYGARAGIWRNYSRAALRGGQDIEVAPLGHRARLDYGVGKFNEDLRVAIDIRDIEAAVNEGRSLDFKLFSNQSSALVIRIPYEYLIGFGMRLGDLGSHTEINREVFETPYKALLDASR